MNIYVGNIPHQASEDDLREAFEAYGEVSSLVIIKDKFTGQSRGFGFVEMTNQQDGENAINGLNEKDFQGRNLTVNEAKPKTENRSFNRGSGGGGSSYGRRDGGGSGGSGGGRGFRR